MIVAERAENAALGLSVLSWAVAGEVFTDPGARLSAVRMTITALNLCVGVLFLIRAPLARGGSLGAVLVSAPSVLSTALALFLAPPPGSWAPVSQILFVLGGAMAIFAFAFLGRAFSVLPALRDVVARGPYRWVRHPAYAGEIVMVAACALARGDAAGGLLFAFTTLLCAARIVAEERVLGASDAYADYARRVRFRVLPGVW